jgi:hypothetical protein
MAAGTGVSAGQPPINFLVHQLRSGTAGASFEFEQMLALLVQTLDVGDAHLIFTVGGDWGIDVLAGELDGQVTVWQAKYFANGVRHGQLRDIRDSFESARNAADANGYRIDRWVLCIPCSMEAPALRVWQRWRSQRQAEAGIVIDLWDETRLRELLLRPEAAHVLRAFYHPYRDPQPPDSAAQLKIGPSEVELGRWAGGVELRIGDGCYLLHDPVEEQVAPDRSWWWREATAQQIEPQDRRVRLRQVEVARPGADSRLRRAALIVQAELLSALDGRGGLPRRLGLYDESSRLTVVTALPAGPTWGQAYRPGAGVLDRLGAVSVLAAMAPACAALVELHRHGHAHRALDPDAIVLTSTDRRGVLRDLGLAAVPPWPGEGSTTYRAAEQSRLVHRRPGPHTDVYQVAAVVYHTITGHLPGPAPNPPVAAAVPGFPAATDGTIARALDPDPGRRPAMSALAAAFRAGRSELSRGGGA